MVSAIHRNLRLRAVGWCHLSMDFLTRYKYYEVIKYIVARSNHLKSLRLSKPLKVSHVEMSRFCRDNRDLDLFVQLMSQQGLFGNRLPLSESLVFDYCCQSGSLPIVQFLHQQGYPATVDAVRYAVNSNNVELVKFLCINRTDGANQEAMDAAINIGNVKIVRVLADFYRGSCQLNPHAHLQVAAANGHLELLHYLEDQDSMVWDRSHAIMVASSEGHLAMVQHLWKSLKDNLNADTPATICVNKAAENGHLNIVKFFMDALKIGQSPEERQAATAAADSSNSLLKKLVSYVGIGDVDITKSISKTLRGSAQMAARNGHLEVLQYINSKPCGLNISLSRCILGDIAILGDLAILEKYYADFMNDNNDNINNNHYNLSGPGATFSNQHLQIIVQRGSRSILEFLHQHGLVSVSQLGAMLPVAVGYAQLGIVSYILEMCKNPDPGAISFAYEETIRYDLYQIMEMLHEAGNRSFDFERYLPMIKLYEPSDVIWWIENKFAIKDLLNYKIVE